MTATTLHELHYTTTTTPLRYNYDYSCSTPHYIQQLWVRWPLQPLQPLQQTQIRPPVGQPVDLPCHPWFTTTNLSYRSTMLKLPPPPCAVLLVFTQVSACCKMSFLYVENTKTPYSLRCCCFPTTEKRVQKWLKNGHQSHRDPSWPILELCWLILGLCWPVLGLCWPVLGPILGQLGAMLGQLGPGLGFKLRYLDPCWATRSKLDDGWPESAEEHDTLVLFWRECKEYTKKYVVSWRCIDHDSDDEQKGDNRDDMFDSKQMKDKKKVQETDSDRQKQTWTGIDRQRYIETTETSQYYFVLQILHKVRPSTTSYYNACTKYFPVLLRTAKLAQSTS